MTPAVEVERALLAHVLADPAVLDDGHVTPALCSDPDCRRALTALVSARERGDLDRAADATLVLALAGYTRQWIDALGFAADGLPLDAVRAALGDRARRRDLAALGDAVQAAARAEDASADTLATLADRLADLAADTREPVTLTTADAAGAAYLDAAAHPLPAGTVLATGLGPLDALLGGGLQRGQLAVLAARPSVGKSALAHQVARTVATTGQHVLLVSPEMTAGEIVVRMLAAESGCSTLALGARPVPAHLLRTVTPAARGLPAALAIDDRATVTTADVRALVARGVAHRRPVALVILDHLGWLADARERGETQAAAVGRQTKALKAIARRHDCAVLALSQLNRASEDGDTMRRPGLAELRSSGEIEQDADVVLLLHRETRQATTGDLLVAKQRNGPTGRIALAWDGRSTRWRLADLSAGAAA